MTVWQSNNGNLYNSGFYEVIYYCSGEAKSSVYGFDFETDSITTAKDPFHQIKRDG